MNDTGDQTQLSETEYLNSIPGMKETIMQGLQTPIEECVDLDWKTELQGD